MAELNDSILSTVKDFHNIDDDITEFDNKLITLINKALFELYQVGFGDTKAFKINGNETTWSSILNDVDNLESIKTFIELDVNLVFDPPQTSYILEAYKTIRDETLWRIEEQIAYDKQEVK